MSNDATDDSVSMPVRLKKGCLTATTHIVVEHPWFRCFAISPDSLIVQSVESNLEHGTPKHDVMCWAVVKGSTDSEVRHGTAGHGTA